MIVVIVVIVVIKDTVKYNLKLKIKQNWMGKSVKYVFVTFYVMYFWKIYDKQKSKQASKQRSWKDDSGKEVDWFKMQL